MPYINDYSLLFLPFSHFPIILPRYLALIATPFLLLWPPPTTPHLLSAPRTAPIHSFTRDAARSAASLQCLSPGSVTTERIQHRVDDPTPPLGTKLSRSASLLEHLARWASLIYPASIASAKFRHVSSIPHAPLSAPSKVTFAQPLIS